MLKTEESNNKIPPLVSNEKPSRPSQPKPTTILDKPRTLQSIRMKDQDLSKSQIDGNSPTRQSNPGPNRNVKYRKSRDFSKSKETEEESPADKNLNDLKQAYAPYYTHNLKKHWSKANAKDYFCRLYRDHFHQIYQEMKICKGLRPVETSILAKKKVVLPKRDTHKGKKVFDLIPKII